MTDQLTEQDRAYVDFLMRDRSLQHKSRFPKGKARSSTAKDGRPTESAVQRSVLDVLKMHPRVVNAWRNNSGTIVSNTGTVLKSGQRHSADIIGMLEGGRMLCIEVKRHNTNPSAGQSDWLARMERGGAVCGVARSAADAVAIVEQGTRR